MGRNRRTKRVKSPPAGDVESRVVSESPPEQFQRLVDIIQAQIREDVAGLVVSQDSPGKRKRDSPDNPVDEFNVVSTGKRAGSVAKASSPLGNQDTTTLLTKSDSDDDVAIRREETELMAQFDEELRREEEREDEEEATEQQQTHVLKTP